MAPRLDLQAQLRNILGLDNVYFQPPANVQLNYPCIIYERARMDFKHADNTPYALMRRYKVTVIDRDPDSDLVDKIAALPLCSHDAFYTADNLNHDVFTLYF
jgi:hypothetical protein